MRDEAIRWINQHPGNEIVHQHLREMDEALKKLKKELEDANKLKEDAFNLADRYRKEITAAQNDIKDFSEKAEKAEQSAKKAADALVLKIDHVYKLEAELGKTVGALDNAKAEAKDKASEIDRLNKELNKANSEANALVKQNHEICEFVMKRKA